MKFRNELGHFVYYDDIAFSDDDDADEIKYHASIYRGDAKRDHDHIIGILEQTKIVRVYDGSGNLLEERIDQSVQRKIDKINELYAKQQAKNAKRRLIFARGKK